MSRSALVLVGIALAVGLFWGGWTVRGIVYDQKVTEDTAAAFARVRAADSVRQAASADYALYRRTADLRIQYLEGSARQLERRAAAHAVADREQDAVLAVAQTAADSVPILTSQRDDARLAYRFATARADSLRGAVDSLHALVARGDSLLRVTYDSEAAREAAFESSLRSLRLEVERAQDRGKWLGLVRIPEGVKLAGAFLVGLCVAKC